MEICINNEWGTVCDDFWGDNDAEVVCRQTGNSGGNNIRCPLIFVFFVLFKIAVCRQTGNSDSISNIVIIL